MDLTFIVLFTILIFTTWSLVREFKYL